MARRSTRRRHPCNPKLVEASAALGPLGRAGAQSAKPVIGILRIASPGAIPGRDLLIEELRRLGYELWLDDL